LNFKFHKKLIKNIQKSVDKFQNNDYDFNKYNLDIKKFKKDLRNIQFFASGKKKTMVTSEERTKVLQMIAESTISVEEGAALLKALETPEAKAGFGRFRRDTADRRMLRVRVDDTYGKRTRVNVLLPMALVNAGLNIASKYVDEIDSEHAAALIEAIDAGLTGLVLDVDGEVEGEHVKVFIE